MVLTRQEALSLLLSAAIAYDTQFATKRSKRHVLTHEQYGHDDDGMFDSDPFDMETPVSTIQAYALAPGLQKIDDTSH